MKNKNESWNRPFNQLWYNPFQNTVKTQSDTNKLIVEEKTNIQRSKQLNNSNHLSKQSNSNCSRPQSGYISKRNFRVLSTTMKTGTSNINSFAHGNERIRKGFHKSDTYVHKSVTRKITSKSGVKEWRQDQKDSFSNNHLYTNYNDNWWNDDSSSAVYVPL